jgi:hypothetical protein
MNVSKSLIALSMALLIAACSDKYEQPAKDAVTSAERALTEARDDASKFAKEELADAEASYEKMKAQLAKKEYKHIVEDTPAFNTKMTTLKDSIVVRQTQLTTAMNQWEDTLSKEVPQRIEAMETRFKSLKPAKLPKEVTKEAYESAKVKIEEVKAEWAAAEAAHAEGRAIEAADKARAAEAKAQEVSEQLATPKA